MANQIIVSFEYSDHEPAQASLARMLDHLALVRPEWFEFDGAKARLKPELLASLS